MPSASPHFDHTTPSSVELVNLTKVYGDPEGDAAHYAVTDMNLKIRAGEFFTFLGPSGCGKTTTLRMIAGFEDVTSGSVLLHGQDVVGTPAYKRNTNTVFQSYALFPHLSIAENVGFGLSVKGVAKAERRDRVAAALDLVRMGHAADRKPSALSGGQQQRIALARALVNEPEVLLLDEPFGALDLKLRREMQLEVKEMQRRLGITFIFVTHDQEEALTMSDRIAVMSQGVIRQVDDPVGIYERPVDRFTADFIGDMNMIEAKVIAVTETTVTVSAAGASLVLPMPEVPLAVGDKPTVAMRPEALTLGEGEATFSGTCGESVYAGTDRVLRFDTAGGETLQIKIRNRLGGVTPPARGETITVSCPLAAIHLLTK